MRIAVISHRVCAYLCLWQSLDALMAAGHGEDWVAERLRDTADALLWMMHDEEAANARELMAQVTGEVGDGGGAALHEALRDWWAGWRVPG